MDKSALRSFLREKRGPEDQLWIEPQIAIVEEFVDFLQATGRPTSAASSTAEDVQAFSEILIQQGLNSVNSYFALLRYGQFVHNDAISNTAIDTLDAHEGLRNLYNRLTAEVGASARDRIFEGISIHVLGMPHTRRAEILYVIMERMESLLGYETTERMLSPSIRTLPDEYYHSRQQVFVESGSVDAYLERRRKDILAILEQCKNEGKLFFAQEITEEVLEFVRDNPEIMNGVREGNIIYAMQIPYLTKQYLAETDERMKRYYYCHCPWARESIKSGKEVSGTFCNCSAGYHKRPWEVIFGQPLRAEVVETVLKGDKQCRFAIYLPAGII